MHRSGLLTMAASGHTPQPQHMLEIFAQLSANPLASPRLSHAGGAHGQTWPGCMRGAAPTRSLTEACVDTAVENSQNLGLKGTHDTCYLEFAELPENEKVLKKL